MHQHHVDNLKIIVYLNYFGSSEQNLTPITKQASFSLHKTTTINSKSNWQKVDLNPFQRLRLFKSVNFEVKFPVDIDQRHEYK